MFKRSFMQAFKVRKNAIPSAYLGSISSNFGYIIPFERKANAFMLCIVAAFLINNAVSDFEFFYQVFTHYPQPAFKTYYEADVPKYIKEANKQVIQNWQKLHEARKLLKTYQIQE